jgi:hypothetical protein
MRNLYRYFSVLFLAGLLAACGGGGGGQNSTLPVSQAPGAQPMPQTSSGVSSPSSSATPGVATTQAAFPSAKYIAFEGEIVATISGGYTMYAAAVGDLHVYTTSSTVLNAHGGTAAVGHYALVIGTGSTSTSISAVYIATFTSAPGQVTVRGTYNNAAPYGFDLHTTNYGLVPVLVTTSTSLSGTLEEGGDVTVQGTGNPNDAVLAASVAAAPAAASAPSTISQTHMITADYLGSPNGTTTVTAAQAAPHLNWAETGIGNTAAISAAGIKTMVYLDMNRLATNSPVYSKLSGSEFEQTCSGATVTDVWDGVTQYITNPASSGARAAIDSWVSAYIAGQPVNAIFADDSDPLSEFPSSYFSPGPPCNYTDAAWIAGEEEELTGFGVDTIVNGFSRMTQAAPIANSTALLANSTTIGGNMESCYVEDVSPTEEGSWAWTGTENTSLLVTGEDKYFECWAMDYAAASSEIASRIYTLASFLMTYSPTYSIFREGYATPSGLHIMPESQFVPTLPVVPQPSNVSTLEESNVYVREYNACYYAGNLVGQCAMIVNNDSVAHAMPALALSYSHTLTLSGAGILDGGSLGFSGAAPPTSVPALSAVIALK